MSDDNFADSAINKDGETILLVCFVRISSNRVTRNCPIESFHQIFFFRNDPK